MKKESHFWAALLVSEARIFYRHNSETDYAISQGGLDLRVTYYSPANCSKKRLWKVYRLVIQYSAWFKKFVKIIFFIYCWLCWFFIAAGLFSACGKQGLLSSYANGLPIAVASVPEHRLSGSCSAWAQTFQLLGSRAQARWLWHTQHVGSSWTGDWTLLSCISTWILHHWAPWEALESFLSWTVADMSSNEKVKKIVHQHKPILHI